MTASHLIAVPYVHPAADQVESGTQRIRHLQLEARALAREQIDLLADDLDVLVVRTAEIAEGGDAYPAGVRELASRITEDLVQKAKTLRGIMDRTAH